MYFETKKFLLQNAHFYLLFWLYFTREEIYHCNSL